MPYPLFRPISLVFLLPLLALAGCCGNSTCICNDRLANSLFISVGRATGTGRNKFSDRELATVYLARYTADTLSALNKPRRALDSLPLPLATRQPASYPVPLGTRDVAGVVVISDNSPFSATTANGNLSRYYYRLYVPRDSSNGQQLTRRRFYRYQFDRISLSGVFEADGCCTCYNNTIKKVRVSIGRATLADTTTTPPLTLANQTDVAGNVSQKSSTRTPVIIYLTKY